MELVINLVADFEGSLTSLALLLPVHPCRVVFQSPNTLCTIQAASLYAMLHDITDCHAKEKTSVFARHRSFS